MIHRIDPEEMRRIFNDNDYLEKAQRGELTENIIDDRHPSLPKAQEPFCTQSQMISYIDRDGNEVARVHQYLRPDSTIGASGRPDPKKLFHDGQYYVLKSNPKKSA